MTPSFGTRLRLQRERQQVSLADIAERTKIRLSLLESLEKDDVRYWPGGIFRRSYLRAYAKAIGLDPEEVVREFLALYPDPTEQADDVLAVAKAMTGAESLSRRPRTRLQFLFDSALDALAGRERHAGQKETRAQGTPVAGIAGTPAEPSAAFEIEDTPFEFESVADELAATDPAALVEAATPQSADATELLSIVDDLPRETPPIALARDEEPAVPNLAARDSEDVAADPGDARTAFTIDLAGMAHLCSRMARVRCADDIAELMPEATRLLHADGLILWMWDSKRRVLWPSFSHGYQADLLKRMPNIRPDADNALAAAFRARETRVVDSDDAASGAVVIPVLTPVGCAGVLALELRNGGERHESVHALATILAAQLAALTYVPPIAQSTPA